MDALQGAIDVDTNIFFSINRMHNMYFDYFMSAYSGKWVWIPMYAAIWYVMLRNFHWKRHTVLHDRPCAHHYFCRPGMCHLDTSLCGAYASF